MSSVVGGTRGTRLIEGNGGHDHEGSLCVCGGKKKKGYWSGYRDDDEGGGEDGFDPRNSKALVKALKGDGKGRFSEIEVRRVVRALGREDRMRL